MDEFLMAVGNACKAAGMVVKQDYCYLTVAGCRFDCAPWRNGNIKFLGSRFKVAEDGSFDVKRAVGLLIAALPERLKATEDMRNAKTFWGMATSLAGSEGSYAKEIFVKYVDYRSARLSATAAGIVVSVTVKDYDALNKVIDAAEQAS